MTEQASNIVHDRNRPSSNVTHENHNLSPGLGGRFNNAGNLFLAVAAHLHPDLNGVGVPEVENGFGPLD